MFRKTMMAVCLTIALASGVAHAGCGPGGASAVVPQSVGPADFSAACETHDDCYAAGVVDRDSCDQTFLDDMNRACDEGYGSPLFGAPCRVIAINYYLAASAAGDAFYQG